MRKLILVAVLVASMIIPISAQASTPDWACGQVGLLYARQGHNDASVFFGGNEWPTVTTPYWGDGVGTWTPDGGNSVWVCHHYTQGPRFSIWANYRVSQSGCPWPYNNGCLTSVTRTYTAIWRDGVKIV